MKRFDITESRSNGSESDHHFNEGPTTTGERLNQWVREHKVCFQVGPLIILNNFTKDRIGFVLYIYAQHPEDYQNRHSKLEDKDWMEIFSQLEKIVQTEVLPEKATCRCEIQPFDFAVRLRPETRLLREIQLSIFVGHRDNIFAPVDEMLSQCVAEMQKKLLHIGAQLHVWRNEYKSPAV